MKLLALGDVVGLRAVEHLEQRLWAFRRAKDIGFVVANGENATEVRGLGAREAERLLAAGVDVITLGDHTYRIRDLYPVLEENPRVIRPANFPPQSPGMGYTVLPTDAGKLLCMNVCGRAFMDPYADPFAAVETILKREAGGYDLSLLDVHAEATSEKLAMARLFDGRVTVMFGTHTHVTTADEQILPRGSGYQTDLGMCGPTDGILGSRTDVVLEKFRTLMPVHFLPAEGPVEAHGTLFTLDDNRVAAVERVVF